jgi:hypothetical protein
MIMKNAVIWMLGRVGLIRTNVSEERSAYIIRAIRIVQLGITFLRNVGSYKSNAT